MSKVAIGQRSAHGRRGNTRPFMYHGVQSNDFKAIFFPGLGQQLDNAWGDAKTIVRVTIGANQRFTQVNAI